MLAGMTTGIAVSITHDGKYAVGRVEENANDAFSSSSRGIMWDMTGSEPKIVELKNLPEMPSTEGSTGKKHVQEAFTQITADGRYIVIYGNQSYGPIGYIYDRQTETYFKFGENANEGPTGDYELEDEPVFSLNGKYVAGDIRDKDDNIFPMVYNTETGKYKYFNSQEDNDLLICCIDNEGNLYGSAPGTSSPVRDWRVCVDNVWYPFDLILKQRYGIEYSDYTGYDNTGTLWSASADTKTLSSMVSPQGESYVVTMPETMTEACRAINLLNNYTATPAAGSNFSNVAVVKITFTHEITVLGNKDCAVLKNAEGAVQRKSMGFAVDKTNPKVLIVTFRNTEMKAGEKYTVEIPAETVALTKNTDKQNDIITINYVGRENVPVKMQSAFPENNAEIARIDNTSNPVILTFDTNISVSDNAKASLVQLDGENEKTICSLSVLSNENQVALMPAASQYLYKGSQYKVVLEAGSLTDVSGSSKSANEQIVLNYTGTYERQISTSDATLFSDNFSTPDQSYKNFMRYEGDHNTPTAAMKKIGFDKDNTPWLFKAKDNNDSKNYFAASTEKNEKVATATCGDIEGGMYIKFSPAITEPGTYTVHIDDYVYFVGTGFNAAQNENPVEFKYTVVAAPEELQFTTDPENESTITSLGEIVIMSDKDIYGTTTPIQAYCDRQVFNGTLTMGDVNRREAYIEFTDAAGEPITAEGEYRIEIPAGVFGNKAWYDSDCLSGACNAATTLYYTVGKEATEITYTADPANGSKVDALGTVTIDNNTTSIMASSGQIVIYKDVKELKKVEAEVVYKDPNDFNEVSHKATVAVNATEKGVYTIEIPEGYFVDENGDNIPAVTLTYYVGVASGIQNINAAIANGTVYNLNGVKVNKANKGIFIVNGKKVAKK